MGEKQTAVQCTGIVGEEDRNYEGELERECGREKERERERERE